MIIRYAEEKDIPKLNYLFESLIKYEGENYIENINMNVKITFYFNRHLSCNDVVLVAVINNIIVGYIHSIIDYDNKIKLKLEASINSLYVIKSYRNNKIGTKLVREMEQALKLKNVKYINVSNIKSNNIARTFYYKLGYNVINETRIKKI